MSTLLLLAILFAALGIGVSGPVLAYVEWKRYRRGQ
jgi:hypothetical protein